MPRPYLSLSSDSLSRLIWRDWDQAAYAEWTERYGHDWPTMAIIDGVSVNTAPQFSDTNGFAGDEMPATNQWRPRKR